MGLQKGPLTYLQDSCAGPASLAPREHTPSGEDCGVLTMSPVSMEGAEAVNPARWHWSKRGASNCEMTVPNGPYCERGWSWCLLWNHRNLSRKLGYRNFELWRFYLKRTEGLTIPHQLLIRPLLALLIITSSEGPSSRGDKKIHLTSISIDTCWLQNSLNNVIFCSSWISVHLDHSTLKSLVRKITSTI